MTKTYQGKPVRAVRDAKQGDKDFDASKTDQVVITLDDGTEKTVSKSEVSESGGGAAT